MHCTLPIALKLTYTLNVAATVTFTLTRQDPGRNVHGRCRKVTRGNVNHARCTRLSALPGALTHTSTAGANTFTFDGRIGGNTLKPGTYVLTATPTSNGGPGIARSATIKLVS
jgi:hypothetical protein